VIEVSLSFGMYIFLIAQVDPDIITGYNIVNFDIPYLIDRSRKLKLDKFEFLSRSLIRKCKYKEATFSSNQTGTRESKEISILLLTLLYSNFSPFLHPCLPPVLFVMPI
jgi:hypothetical protein